MNPSLAQLKVAREAAASVRPFSHNSALILDGERDATDIVQSALAAVVLTTKYAAELSEIVINDMRGSGESDLRCARARVKSAIMSFDHLKGKP